MLPRVPSAWLVWMASPRSYRSPLPRCLVPPPPHPCKLAEADQWKPAYPKAGCPVVRCCMLPNLSECLKRRKQVSKKSVSFVYCDLVHCKFNSIWSISFEMSNVSVHVTYGALTSKSVGNKPEWKLLSSTFLWCCLVYCKCKMALTFGSVLESLKCIRWNEICRALFSCFAVYHAVQGVSNFWVYMDQSTPKVGPFKWKLLSIYCTRWLPLFSLWVKS